MLKILQTIDYKYGDSIVSEALKEVDTILQDFALVKDNPVPSLDKKLDELLNRYKWNKKKRLLYIDKLSLAHLKDFTKFLKENLQNGVETEQN